MILGEQNMDNDKYICSDCGRELDKNIAYCPNCGSKSKTLIIEFFDSLEINDKFQLDEKKKDVKKPIREYVSGADKCKSKDKFVEKTRVIDRENDCYYEKVVDPDSGEIIRFCKEPLSKHIGHGSAKNKKYE